MKVEYKIPKSRNKNIKISFLLVFLIILFSGCIELFQPTGPRQEGFKVGETANDRGLEMTINSYRYVQTIDLNTPREGNIFLIVNIIFQNKGNITRLVNLSYSSSVIGKSAIYGIGVSPYTSLLNNSFNDGWIDYMEKIEGEVVYEVPRNWTNIWLAYGFGPHYVANFILD